MENEVKKELKEKQKKISFESYGVKISIEADCDIDFNLIKNCLADSLSREFNLVENQTSDHIFYINGDNFTYSLEKNKEKIVSDVSFEFLLDTLESKVRITVAEFAVGRVFLHAGVVAIDGKAIVIPARSYHGKTSLVAALIRQGAVYYSDEYAVLDENGYVHPFPKMLSVRGIIDQYAQKDLPVEEFGAVAGTDAVPVAMVLITEYVEGAEWKPEQLSAGQGIMEILPHTIPIRNKPEFTLNVLNNVAERAIITKTMRAEAVDTALLIKSFFAKLAFKI
jgi:hypothetical protein